MNRKAIAVYPSGTRAETELETVEKGDSILPEVKGWDLPRISMALEREPTSTETLADGSLQETYNDFSETDYNAFSQYLQKTGYVYSDESPTQATPDPNAWLND